MRKWETIIKVAGEGGSITLLGLRDEKNNWCFKHQLNEIDFDNEKEPSLPEEKADISEPVLILKPTVHINRGIVDNWNEAIELLNQYRWFSKFIPKEVHPAFCNEVWNTVSSKCSSRHTLDKWKKVCFNQYYDK